MYLTRHLTGAHARWAADGKLLSPGVTLSALLAEPGARLETVIGEAATDEPARGELLAPIEPTQELWASGVTYLRSREARMAEAREADVYDRVYAAERPELFFKALGKRVAASGMPVRIRRDSTWDVPEPELALVINAHGEVVGYTAGNDMSSRAIEGENPLYLPQAKMYEGSSSLGEGLWIGDVEAFRDAPIELRIERAGEIAFEGRTSTGRMRRRYEELVAYLTREMVFEEGVLLLTGTGLVPPEDFTLAVGDSVHIRVGEVSLENKVERDEAPLRNVPTRSTQP